MVPLWSDCLDGGKLTVWCFGHTRHPLDFTDSGVRFVCNPRGRPGKGDNIPYSVHLIDTSALTGRRVGKRAVSGGQVAREQKADVSGRSC